MVKSSEMVPNDAAAGLSAAELFARLMEDSAEKTEDLLRFEYRARLHNRAVDERLRKYARECIAALKERGQTQARPRRRRQRPKK